MWQRIALVGMLLAGLFTPAAMAANPVLIEVYAPSWCQPCQRMEPIVQKLKTKNIPILQVDLDAEVVSGLPVKVSGKQWAQAFNINTVPTFMVFTVGPDGKLLEVGRKTGEISEQALLQLYLSALKQTPTSAP